MADWTQFIGIYVSIIFVISVLISIVIALTFMASRVFKVTEMEAYLNVELSELFNSFLIMFFAIAFFIAADAVALNISQEVLGAHAASIRTAPQAAQLVLQDIVLQVQEGMGDMFTVQVCLSILNTFQRRIGEFVLTLSYKVFPGVDSIVGITNVVGYALVGVFGSLVAQLTLFNIIDASMSTFFLPAGIILRFFPPTRESGVFLIALAIGLQAVFPMVYLINQKVMNDIASYADPNDPYDIFSNFKGYKSPAWLVKMICGGKYFFYGSLTIPFDPGGVIYAALRKVFSEAGINLLTPFEFKSILNSIAFLSLPSLFLPALATTITFAFINALTKFMLSKM